MSEHGVRIAGTLLRFYRVRARLVQERLAERLNVDLSTVARCEQGDTSNRFMADNIGAVAEALGLSEWEIAELRNGVRADEFLQAMLRLRARHKVNSSLHSLSIALQPDLHHWLRLIFASNNLRGHFGDSDTIALSSPHLAQVLDRQLVVPQALVMIRDAIQTASTYAIERGVALDRVSELLLYMALSVVRLNPGDPQRLQAVCLIQGLLGDPRYAPLDAVAERRLAHGLCELGDERAMCHYIAKTEDRPEDAARNLAYLSRRAADMGEGVQVLTCMLKLLRRDQANCSAPLCTLDLRTTAQLLAAHRDAAGARASVTLQSRQHNWTLASNAMAFFRSAQPTWLAAHRCEASGPACQDTADHYAREIVKEIARL